MRKLRENWIYIVAMAVGVAVDQVTKGLVVENVKGTSGIDVVSGVFRLQYLENTGTAFGMWQNHSTVFLFIVLIVLAFLVLAFARIPDGRKYVPLKGILTMTISGAVGNLVDRIHYGYVVDFLYFELIHFPIFNVADCLVSISAVLLFCVIVFHYKDEDLEFIWPKGRG